MKRIILTYGLVAGAIVGSVMLVTMPLYLNGTFDFSNGEVLGYSSMVIALSMVFFGVKSYRDKHKNGIISFGKAVQVGMLITAVAAVMYGLAWEVCYSQIGEEFSTQMTVRYFEKMEKQGISGEELNKAKEEWTAFSEMYKNPLIRFGVTITEILPVGIILTLLSAGLLRKKEFLPDTETKESKQQTI